jgi:hypothetical protein
LSLGWSRQGHEPEAREGTPHPGSLKRYLPISATRRFRKRLSGSVCASLTARSYSVRLVYSAEAAEQIGSRRVEVLVAVEVEPLDQDQPGLRPIRLGHGDRPVQLHDRRAGQTSHSP